MTGASPLLDTFAAPGPDPALADRLALFGRFVGTWQLEVTNFAPDGTATTVPGEWHFGWALGGRAVADVWICPPRAADGSSPGEHGLSVRFPDADADTWRSTWVGPARGVVWPFVARPVDGRIVLDGHHDGVTRRWSFSDITESTFRWRNEESTDGGATWRLVQTFSANRS